MQRDDTFRNPKHHRVRALPSGPLRVAPPFLCVSAVLFYQGGGGGRKYGNVRAGDRTRLELRQRRKNVT